MCARYAAQIRRLFSRFDITGQRVGKSVSRQRPHPLRLAEHRYLCGAVSGAVPPASRSVEILAGSPAAPPKVVGRMKAYPPYSLTAGIPWRLCAFRTALRMASPTAMTASAPIRLTSMPSRAPQLKAKTVSPSYCVCVG